VAGGCDRAEALLHVKRPREALSALEASIDRDPEDVRAHCLMALAHIRLGEYSAAAPAAREAIHLSPNGEWGHRLLAIALLNQGRHSEALDAATTAAQLDPDSPEVLRDLSTVQLANGLSAEAYTTAQRLVALAPAMASAHQAVAAAARGLRQYLTAETAMRCALHLEPAAPENMNDLGVALLHMGQRHEARALFLAAANADPTCAPALHNLRLMARQDRFPISERSFFPLVPIQVLFALLSSIWLRRAYADLPPELRDELLNQPWRGLSLWLPRVALLMLTAFIVYYAIAIPRGDKQALPGLIGWSVIAMPFLGFLVWRWSTQRRRR
jgi:Flp pilus assembly protein TadD